MTRRRSLGVLLSPRSVAVVGASRTPGAIGHEVFRNLLEAGFRGPVYPVNPVADHVRSVRAYRSLDEIPGDVDLAVLTVPPGEVAKAARQAGEKGVKGLVVITAGFGEVGGEGLERQEELRRVIEHYGMRMVGPNCLGIVNTDPEVRLNATFAPHYPPEGRVAFASQSGALGVAILDHARELGIGISSFVSIGNRVDFGLDELLEHWNGDPRTQVILLYMESFGDPKRFSVLAREVGRRIPIVAVKGGRTVSGAKAARSHTGSLAGGERASEALLHQAGVIRVDTVEELFDMAMVLENQPLPCGKRLGILTNAGGPGILAADAAEAVGLQVPALSERTRAALGRILPREASTANPVDMIAGAGPDQFQGALSVLLGSGELDALLVLFVPPIASRTGEVAKRIVEGSKGSGIPVVTCFLGSHGVPEALRTLEGGGVPSYRYPEAAVRALARAGKYQAWRSREEVPAPELAGIDSRRGRAAVAESQDDGWLRDQGVRDLLEAYGIFHVETRPVRSEEEAVAVAERLGYPLAMKVVAEGILHKSDVRGVRLGLRDGAQVRAAFRALAASLEERGQGAAFRGALLQPMVRDGVEIAVGTVRDPLFGPLVMVGIGGVNLEVLGDVRFGLPPLSATDVAEMIRSLRGYPLLSGYRGNPPADVEALTELVLRVDRMLTERPEIVEMDLNPVMVLPRGLGCTVVDARVRVVG